MDWTDSNGKPVLSHAFYPLDDLDLVDQSYCRIDTSHGSARIKSIRSCSESEQRNGLTILSNIVDSNCWQPGSML
jgi:hypothetical protein